MNKIVRTFYAQSIDSAYDRLTGQRTKVNMVGDNNNILTLDVDGSEVLDMFYNKTCNKTLFRVTVEEVTKHEEQVKLLQDAANAISVGSTDKAVSLAVKALQKMAEK